METINIKELEVLPNEIWKLHKIGVAVSNLGRCFVPKNYNKKSHYTSGSNSNGYKHIKLEGKNYKVHRLIAECFIENPNNYPTVDHINRNPSDNRVENLRWATMSMQNENQTHNLNCTSSKQVARLDSNTNEIIEIYPSTMEAQRNGFKSSIISKCCLGQLNTHKGYKWQYIA